MNNTKVCNKLSDYILPIVTFIVTAILFVFSTSCASVDNNTQYTSNDARSDNTLIVPPNLTAPTQNVDYQMSTLKGSGYLLDQATTMHVVEAGSQRWLIVKNNSVNAIWPVMLAYLKHLGLTVKKSNQASGFIETNWATINDIMMQSGIRALISKLGSSDMYQLPAKYSFRVNIWQNESATNIFVTDYQISEMYSNCGTPHNSTIEPSNYVETKWVSFPPNAQLELNFLVNFITFANNNAFVVTKNIDNVESVTSSNMALIANGTLVLFDQLDNAWWRTALALERVNLGIADKNRSKGLYYVYPLQSDTANTEPGFFAKLFKKQKSDLTIPQAQYVVQLQPDGDKKTVLTLSLIAGNGGDDFTKRRDKYLVALLKQLQ